MRFVLIVPVFLFLAFHVSQAAAQDFVLEGHTVDEEMNESMEEYDNVPPGLLAPPASQVKAATKKKDKEEEPEFLPDSYGQIPGIYKIPGADKYQQEDVEKQLSIEGIRRVYAKGEYDVAVKNLVPLVQGGDHDAVELMGVMYLNGQGVTKNPERAFELFTTAAEAGRPLAEHYLSIMMFTGQGVPEPDLIRALMWMEIAILHYPPGPERDRAKTDRDAIYVKMTRVEKNRALDLAREILSQRGEAHLLDMRE